MKSDIIDSSETRLADSSLWSRAPIAFAILGIAMLALWQVAYRQDMERALYAYVFSYISMVSVMLGCMGFVLIQHVTRAGWSVVIRRIAENAMATAPLFLLLFLPIAMGAHEIFSWTHIGVDDQVLREKEPYLNLTSFGIRSAGYLITWIVIGVWFAKKSVDIDSASTANGTRAMWKWSALSIIIYSITLTFASVDWIMSLQPHWYSTIFGIYFFAGCLLSGMALITLTAMGLQRSGYLKGIITTEHYHDLGKLLFGFTVFWAYIGFSQFMLYWYASIPEEIEFYLHRMHNGWDVVSWSLPVINFFIPFILLMSRHAKRNRITLGFACVWIIVAHLIDIYWLVMPNYGAHNLLPGEHAPHFHFGWQDGVALVALGSLFLAYFTFLIKKRTLVPRRDPRLAESLNFENF